MKIEIEHFIKMNKKTMFYLPREKKLCRNDGKLEIKIRNIINKICNRNTIKCNEKQTRNNKKTFNNDEYIMKMEK